MDDSNLPCVIIQNKIDKIKDVEVKQNYMEIGFLENFARKNKFDCFFQTSAKTGENIDYAISSFLRLVIDKYEKFLDSSVIEKVKNENIKLENTKTKKNQRKNCC